MNPDVCFTICDFVNPNINFFSVDFAPFRFFVVYFVEMTLQLLSDL